MSVLPYRENNLFEMIFKDKVFVFLLSQIILQSP